MPKPAPKPADDQVKGHAAGTMHVAPDGDILLLHRSSAEENYAGHWALPGGKAEDGEEPEDAADREVHEETGFKSGIPKRKIDEVTTPNGMRYHTFVKPTFDKFTPKLNDEHCGFTWASLGMLPQPLHPAVAKTIAEKCGTDGAKLQKWSTEAPKEDIAQDGLHASCGGQGCAGCGWSGLSPIVNAPMKPALDSLPAMDEAIFWLEQIAGDGPVLAFDRAPIGLDDLGRDGIVVNLAFDRDVDQGKSTDDFERMHVKRAPITKAGVNPYYGREIPKGRELGLEPGRVYKLLRHPDEIRKAAPTFHNLPLLSKHVPHSADDHDGDITVGTVGSEAEYEHPYLYNSLAVWSRDGRDYVDEKKQKELSSAYSYDADMTPGTYEGEPYDGVMRNMVGNHVCLVKKGRAGSDVALDEALKPEQETTTMSTKNLKSMKATVAYGGLIALIKPKLAMDAQINLKGALATFEPGKFKAAIPNFVAALRKGLKGKLAQDGDLVGVIEGVEKLMASIDGDKTVEDAEIDDAENVDPNAAGGEEEDTTMDGDNAAIIAYLKSKGVDDAIIAGLPKEAEAPAADADVVEQEEGDAGEGGKKAPPFAKDKAPTFGAMDAAIAKVRKETIQAMNDVAAARAHVLPIVGEIKMAFDSAEGVYHQAFKMQGKPDIAKKVKGVEALREMWDLMPVPGARPARETIALDSASVDNFAKQFPNMAKVKRA